MAKTLRINHPDGHSNEFVFRTTTEADRTYISRLSYLAEVFGDETVTPPSAGFLRADRFYVGAWEPDNGGIVAVDAQLNNPAGGAWLIDGTEELHGTGYVAEGIPELAIAVEKRYWRQGLGRELLYRTVDLARQLGREGVSLSVHDNNHKARALYESSGFKFHRAQPEISYTTMVVRF